MYKFLDDFGTRMPRVRVSPLGPKVQNPLLRSLDFSVYMAGINARHPASKAGFLLWAKCLSAAGDREKVLIPCRGFAYTISGEVGL